MNATPYVFVAIVIGCLTSEGLLAQTKPDPRDAAAGQGEASQPKQKPSSPPRPAEPRAKSRPQTTGSEISGACPAVPAPSEPARAQVEAKGKGAQAGTVPKTATECSN